MITQNYDQELELNVKGYEGKYSSIILKCPDLYRLSTSMLFNSNIDQRHRSMILTSIGYFIIPQDLYPEELHGPIGYIDDIMLLLFSLRSIEQNYGIEELLMYWNSTEEELKELIFKGFEELITDNIDLYDEVIEFVGF